MADLFTLLASHVLGSEPEVEPLLPSRFAAWPDLPLTSPLAQPPAPVDRPVDRPTSADTAVFPPPLIDPDHPAMDTPLPSLRQLSQVGTGPGPSIQPYVPPVPEATPEAAGAEPGDMQPDAAPPLVPTADGSRTEPTTATPPPDVGQTRRPLPAPPAQPVVQEGDGSVTGVAPGLTSQPADAPITPLVPEPTLEPITPPEPAPVLQRASQSQPGDFSPGPARPADNLPPHADGPPAATRDQAAAAQEDQAVDAPIMPLVPEPVQEPAAAPEPAPVLQGAAPYQPGDSSPGLASPPADAPITPLVPDPALEPPAPAGPPAALAFSPGHDRPTIHRRADTAEGDQSSSISPLQPVSPYQPGDSSPGPARPPADALITPLVPGLALEPPAPAGPPAAPAFSPGHDRPDTAKGDQLPSISPLQRASPSQPGDSSPGPARNQKAAVQEGRRVDAPPAQPSPRTKLPVRPGEPVVLRNGDARADSHIWPGPAEPIIVPAPEPASAQKWPPTRAREGVFSRPFPARPESDLPEPPPTVRVTIGRVEVRAAADAERPAARRVELPRPPLSLDDYLEATKGGEP